MLVATQAVRTAITIAALTLLVGLGSLTASPDPAPPTPSHQIDMTSGPLESLMQQNRCSVTGFDRSIIPSNAIVRTPDGLNEVVTFDRGWAVFRGQAPGELVAVCLGPVR